MKKILLFLAITPLFFFSCKSKNAENATPPLPNKVAGVEKAGEPQTHTGKWKMVEWNDPSSMLNAAEKQKVMDATEIEITNDGKFISRAEGNENTVAYTYYENTRKMMLPTGEGGKMESMHVSFNGNRMTLSGDKGSMVLERK
jgi:hypothetical protein